MRITTRALAVASGTLAGVLVLTSCGSSGGGADVTAAQASNLTGVPKQLSDDGAIKIGVKFDQPGIGNKAPGADAPEGFDIEIGRIVAARLGISDGDIEWVETISDNRETFLKDGTVDVVLASYSITDDRRKVVGQAGPYYVTGQQLLVRTEDEDTITGPDQLKDVKVCSVEGSTSLQRVEEDYGASPVPFGTYSECVDQLENKTVDAVTTDGAILLGYAAENPDELKVVGEPFSEERYGIGYNKDAEGMCEFLSETLQDAYDSGGWADAFGATLGESGVDTPEQPTLDGCP